MTTQRLLELTFLGGALGSGAELLLMGHTEGAWQVVPVALLAAGSVALLADVVRASPATRRLFLALMVAFATSGITGAVLHVDSNVEFARELDPDLHGLTLLREAMTGATPALAPGAMVLLAAVGWASRRPERHGARGTHGA